MTRRRDARLSVIRDKGEVYAARRTDDYPDPTPRSGKWLCFIASQDTANMWPKVAKATESGELGSFSVLRRPRPNLDGRVIEVHTYDWADEADVRRVRGALRNIGWVSRIPYKADSQSSAQIYKETGFVRISKYYE